jgi:hypothetical protein
MFELHVFLHVEENARVEFFPLASSRRVAAEFVRIASSRPRLLAICWHFRLKPILPAGEAARRERLKNWLQR